ncbi:MAG: M1 family aminopeptidase [Gemmatimonadota bacterium]
MRLSLLLIALIPVSLAAQTNAERMTNDAYTRSHDYDLVHQRIELADFNWDSTSFTGRVITTLIARRPAFDSVVLDAGHLLTIRRVTNSAGAALRTARHGDTLVVFFSRAIDAGDTTRFTISYGGKVENGHGLTFLETEGRAHRPQQIWSQGEDDNNHDWFPTFDFPNDKMTWELAATVPPAYTVVSNGSLVSDVRGAKGRTMTWRQDKPSATYLVSIVVAPLVKIADRWKGIPVDYYVYREDSARARPLFRVTPDMIDVYSRLTGVRYPWAKYAQTTVADFFGGMENVSATTLVDWLPDPTAYADRPWYQYILIPHELAHQWFGDYVTTENWANMWLNEGFAEYMPGMYWSAKLGQHAEDDYYADEYRQFMQIDARRRMPVASLGSNNIYPKGALVLRMLEKYLGEKPFWASINRYLTEHALDNATTDDLRQAVLDATGQNLDWFWSEWVYQAGYPEFTISSAFDSAAHTVTLLVKQTQVDTATADSATGLRFTTPPVFRMPVAVRVGTARGDIVRRFQLDSREQTLIVDSVMSEPTMVIFDDGNGILKRLTFVQPSAWLATALERDADLWNREWLIGQLGRKPADSLAGLALARAASGADYFLTRAQAATALGSFPATMAVPALEGVLRDTSAQVRAAAVDALARIRDPRVVQLIRDRWTEDASYTVKAAALRAIVRVDSAGRRAAIVEGLKSTSYQDAIRQAAYAGIAQSNDTSFIDAVVRGVPEDESTVYVLASFASKGNQRALDLLVGELDNDRRFIRNWALGAIRDALPAPVALARLNAVKDSLKYADTRSAVAEAIEGLSGDGH